MRLTIERMRALVLVSGGLLVAALVVFLVAGKWRNPFNLRDIPKRLGVEIQQEANGVTYTQAHGGRTLFKLHASKVVQLKKGNAVLHDVKIELYGVDGSRVDRIEGAEFQYDQQAGTATAAGQVEITLMRPGVPPAIAPKARPGHAVADKPKGHPLTGVAATVESGQIHVKTSGLTFDQNSGVSTTTQRVDFAMTQGNGSAVGASYDSENGLLVLDHAVVLDTRQGSRAVELHAQHAEFDKDDQICHLRMALADSQGERATATEATIHFREDGSAERLDAAGGFTLATVTGGHLAAPTGTLEFDEKSQPLRGQMQGGVVMDSKGKPAGAGSFDRLIHGTAAVVDLEFAAQGQLRHAHLERDVTMDSEERREGELVRRHWRSPVAEVEFRDAGKGRTEPSTIYGKGGVVVTGENQRDEAQPSKLEADELTAQLAKGAVLSSVTGVGHASMDQTTAQGARQSTSGDRLEAHFAPPVPGTKAGTNTGPATGLPAGTKAGPNGAPAIQLASMDGHVVLVQYPARKAEAQPQPPLRATAGHAVYEGAGEWLHLTLRPRFDDAGMQMTAEKLDVSQESGDAFAQGNVKASWVGQEGGGKQGAQPGVALGGQGPAHVVSAEAQLHQASGEATFRGKARLWQQSNSVAAPVIVLNHLRRTLEARSTDAAEPVKAVLLSAQSGHSSKDAEKDTGAKVDPPSVIRMRGGELHYSDAERKAVMRGGALGLVVAETGETTSVSEEVELILLPPGNHAGKDGGAAQVDRLTASGRVTITSQCRRGTGEQLVYSGETGEYVLTGTTATPPRMTDVARGMVTGEALIFDGRDDSVRVEGGKQQTRTETTAPR